MKYMFADCVNIKKLDLSKFNTKNVNNMNGMFLLNESLEELDLSSFDTSNVENMEGMFTFLLYNMPVVIR